MSQDATRPLRVVALEYHDVIEGSDFDASGFPGPAASSYKLAGEDFAAHMQAIADVAGFGARVQDLSVVDAGPSKVLLTFDDGGVSARDGIADVLERHGATAHIFMTTGRLGDPAFCSDADLRALVARGHVVGSHSQTHPTRMATLSERALREEWETSTRRLEDILGAKVDTASVPGGYFSRLVAETAEAAGIRWLFTSEPLTRVEWVGQCAVLGRYTLRRHSTPAEVLGLVAAGGWERRKQWIAWNAKKAAKAVGGSAYLQLRRRFLGS